MAWVQIHASSKALGMDTGLQVLLPQAQQEKPLKVVYLLHGYSDDNAHWLRYTSLERECAAHPVAIVMPETNNGYWVNTKAQWNYFDYLTDELPKLCSYYFPISDKREDTMVAGFSMGGYGALHTALNCPSRYGYCAAFAPAIEVWNHYQRQRPLNAPWLFGPQEELMASDENLYRPLERCVQQGVLPKLMLTVGNDDGLKPQSERFVAHLQALGQTPVFEPVAGKHDWYFAQEAFLRALSWFEGEV